MTNVCKLYVLLCGYEVLQKTISTRNRGARFVLSEPVSAYLIETTEGLILVDTGLNSTLVNDATLREHYYTGRGWTPPVVLPQHELLYQLDQIGVRPADIERVILTHMHLDHAGNLKHFQHARIFVQRLEHEYAFSSNHSPAWFDIDYRFPDTRWEIVDGDWTATNGLECVLTRGHTPGHQSLVVTLPSGAVKVLVADAGDLQENWDEEVLPGESVDDDAALHSIRRLKQIAHERNGELFLGHDPQFIQQVRLAPEWYE